MNLDSSKTDRSKIVETGEGPGPNYSHSIWLAGLFLVPALLLGALNNLYQLNTDAVSYIRIAGYYCEWNTDLMISGYWGPMLSWVMVPFLLIGVDPLIALRCAMLLSGVVFWTGCIVVLKQAGLRVSYQIAGSWLAAGSAAAWSVVQASPDLLLAGWIGLGMGLLWSKSWVQNSGCAVLAGLLFSASYYTKAIGLPLSLLLVAVMTVLLCWLRRDKRRGTLKAGGITLLVLVLASAPWITILSLTYDRFTFGTSGQIAHAVVGPGGDFGRHPLSKEFVVPEPGRVTVWEEPSRLEYPYWNPLASPESLAHQLKLIAGNFITWIRLMAGMDLFCLGLLSCLIALWFREGPKETLRNGLWRWSVVPVLLLAALYMPVYIGIHDERYLYPVFPFLMVLAFGSVDSIAVQWKLSQIFRRAMAGIVIFSFALPVFLGVKDWLTGRNDFVALMALELTERIQSENLSAPVAGNGMTMNQRAGLYVAFFLGEPWCGDFEAIDANAYRESPAPLIVLHRRHPVVPSLMEDPAFLDLDARLFEDLQEAAVFPLKVFHYPEAAEAKTR